MVVALVCVGGWGADSLIVPLDNPLAIFIGPSCCLCFAGAASSSSQPHVINPDGDILLLWAGEQNKHSARNAFIVAKHVFTPGMAAQGSVCVVI